jgi:hypothetical protein
LEERRFLPPFFFDFLAAFFFFFFDFLAAGIEDNFLCVSCIFFKDDVAFLILDASFFSTELPFALAIVYSLKLRNIVIVAQTFSQFIVFVFWQRLSTSMLVLRMRNERAK